MRHILQVFTNHSAYDQIRILEPLTRIKHLLWENKIVVDVKSISNLSPQGMLGHDHVIFHGVCSTNLINLLKVMPCPFSFAADDLQTEIPAWNPSRISEVGCRTLTWCLEHSKRVICTTPALAEHYSHFQCLVAPNLLDFNQPESNPSDVVGGLFGNSHAADIDLLGEVKHPFLVMSNCLPARYTYTYRDEFGNVKQRPNAPHVGFVEIEKDYEKYKIIARNLKLGVGLVPLVDCNFNRKKSILKFLEYTQMNAVTVCSNVSPYSEIPSECIVKVSDNSDWDEAIYFALAHKQMIATRAYDYCLANYSYRFNKDQWIDVYKNLANI